MISRKRIIGFGAFMLVVGAFVMFTVSRAKAEWFLFRSRRIAPPPVPLGSSVDDWRAAQITAADADHFVIYRHEWFQGGTTLGPYGRYHLQEISKRVGSVPFPVLIQVDTIEILNAARRLEIVNQLLAQGIADAPQRVILGYPRAEGLNGDEAARVFGQSFGIGTGGFGSLGGSGTGTGLPSGGGLGTSFGTGFGGGFRGY